MNATYERAGYNETKTEILSIVKYLGEATTDKISELTGKRYENISVLCLLYHRQGLLSRHRLPGSNAYVYAVSERGIDRLNWLKQEEETEIDDEDIPYN
ncbi:unnamed protein product [marine sediment metagenome]|uniref:MarR family transcriptional regulator n=1 Tax=marine sediment metagenome TaxID=412755 RepID=X1TG87_9ZZZZ